MTIIQRKTEPQARPEPKSGDLTRAFYSDFGNSYSMVCPNVFQNDWTEMDILGLTKAGLCHEIEIKVSRSDFRADAKKVISATSAPSGRKASRIFLAA